MKKIACVGYHGTGAGVVDDLFREFDNVCHGTYEAEVRVLHDPDGISDLEYHLVNNPHRLSSGLVLKRFLAYCQGQNRQASKIFGEDWMRLAKEYVESLALIKYHGYTKFDLTMASPFTRVELYVKKCINKLKPRKYRYASWHDYLPQMQTYYSLLDEDVFLAKTKDYIERLCAIANRENKEYLMLDQFVSVSNPSRCLRYVNDIKTIVVDRDPRDLFINQTLCGSPVLPKDAHKFCVVYKNIRRFYGERCDDVFMIVRFEDLVYHYDENVKRIIDFVGISREHHKYPQKYFNPSDSGARTQLWLKYPQFADSVRIIEEQLPDFLYEFPKEMHFLVGNVSTNNHHLLGKS